MSTQQIIEALQCNNPGCKCKNDHLKHRRVHCPGHADQKPSLSIKEKDGKTLFKCRIGCLQGTVIQALRELNLWPRTGVSRDNRKHTEHTKAYEIRDTTGRLFAIHYRKDTQSGKEFSWGLPDGTRGLGGMPTAELPLYGAETLQSVAKEASVVITEGEKAADSLRALGIPALGTVTGSAVPGAEALKPLAGWAVILWADNDDAGRRHMDGVGARLINLGCQEVRWVSWREAPDKGDAADAVLQGVAVPELLAGAELWQPGNINLDQLLDMIVSFLLRYVVLTDHQASAIALWIAHTHALDAAECTPYLSITSAEKQSGKTRLLEVLALLVARPWFTGRATSAVLVRKIEKVSPTLLLDETDAAFKSDKEYSETLRGVLNSGYQRGGVTSLCVKLGGDYDLRDFSVFCPKALAGIGRLPDTVQDRSITIEMRRKAPGEPTERFRRRHLTAEPLHLRGSLEDWAPVALPILESAMPGMPEQLDDRATDVWEPLLGIADLAGGTWPDRAREAASTLSAKGILEDSSQGVDLLKDIREVFTETDSDRLSSATLIAALADIEEAPWGDLHGRPLDARRLARTLKPYGIKPVTIRLPDGSTPKGYLKGDFTDSWNRYLPVAATSATSATNLSLGMTGVADVADVADKSGIRHH